MFRKRLTERIKAGFAWSVISEEGECIPGNETDAKLPSDESVPNSKIAAERVANEMVNIPSAEAQPSAIPCRTEMEDLLDNSTRKFKPEFLLDRPKPAEPAVKEPAVKRPTAAFRVVSGGEADSVDVPATILLPDEMVESCELLAESVISMSVSVLASDQIGETALKSAIGESARTRSIEFRSYVPKEMKKTG